MTPAKLPRRAFEALRDVKRTNSRQRRLLVRAGLMGQQRVDRKSVRFVLTPRGMRLQAIVREGKVGWTRLRWLLSPKGRYVTCVACDGWGFEGVGAKDGPTCPKCEGVGKLERKVA